MQPTDRPTNVLRLQIGHGSDTGRQRPLNEDFYGVAASQPAPSQVPRCYWHVVERRLLAERGQLFVVADGMGGHNAGELASQRAVEVILGAYYSYAFVEPGQSLRQAIDVANREILAQAQSGDPALANMGTTVTAVVVRENRAVVAHLGDSRCYLVTPQEAAQLTQDHTWVRDQIQAGVLTEEEAQRHTYRHVLSRTLGREGAEPELLPLELHTGDRLVLCSDGLSNLVAPQELQRVVLSQPPQEAVDQLLALANERGGADNVTAVVVQVDQMAELPAAGILTSAPASRSTLSRTWLATGALALAAIACGAMLAINGLTGIGSRPAPTPTKTLAAATATLQAPILAPTATVFADSVIMAQPDGGEPEAPAQPGTETPPSANGSSPTLSSTLAPEPTATPYIYIVVRGDSLSDLAARFNCSQQEIIAVNGITNPDVIYAGQRLTIPAPCVEP